MKLVEVTWVDSHTDNDWQTVDALRRSCAEKHALLMLSVGYLAIDEADYVVLVGTRSQAVSGDDEMVNNVMQIPRSAVTRISSLERRDNDGAASEQRVLPRPLEPGGTDP